MKKLFLIILFLVVALISTNVHSATAETNRCYWIWSTSFASATADAPDFIYCSSNGRTYQKKTASSHAQYAAFADTISLTWDTVLPDNNNTIGDIINSDVADSAIVPCQNAATVDVNILASADGTNFSAGGVYYHSESSLADADTNTFGLTPIDYFQVRATEGSASVACLVVVTTVSWKK